MDLIVSGLPAWCWLINYLFAQFIVRLANGVYMADYSFEAFNTKAQAMLVVYFLYHHEVVQKFQDKVCFHIEFVNYVDLANTVSADAVIMDLTSCKSELEP